MSSLLVDGVVERALPVSQGRLVGLDLLRGLCAIAVGIYHLTIWSEIKPSPFISNVLSMVGLYGVSAFFVLSGYSLAFAYDRRFDQVLHRVDVAGYFRRRVARLAPMFFVVVLLSVFAKIVLLGRPLELHETLANMVLLFGFADASATPVIGGWSIGVEVVFYVFLPLMLLLRQQLFVVLAASVLLTAWISERVGAVGSLEAGWSTYVQASNHFVFFCGGVMMYVHREHLSLRSSAVFWILVAVVAFVPWLALGTDVEMVTGWRRGLLVLATMALVLVFAELDLSRSAWCVKCSEWLGGASFPLYLLHPLIFFGLSKLVSFNSVTAIAATLLLSLLIAFGVDRVLDAPLQKRLRANRW